MAEPQRASYLPDPPAWSRLARRPRPPQPSRYAAPPRLPLDATQDLSPSAHLEGSAAPLPPIEAEAFKLDEAPRRDGRPWHAAVARQRASRSPGEWVLMAVVLLGLALNVSSLLTNAALSPSDRLLGSAVFLVGLALLVLMEVCRKAGHTSR